MLSHTSGTTDQSTAHSSLLESIETDVCADRLGLDAALTKVVHFASTNFNLDLSEDLLKRKIDSLRNSVSLAHVKDQLS